jgi:hypothetical protein
MTKIYLAHHTEFRRFMPLLIGICSFAIGAMAQSASFSATSYPIVGNTHIAVDLNRDGSPDLAGSGLNAASVMLNNGDGTFRPRVDFPAAGQTQDVAAGDFNSDGNVDLVVTINTPQISLSLLTGNGDGTFNAPVNFANTSGADSPDVAAVDLNNDKKLDVVIMHTISCFTAPCVAATTISVMMGNGDGTFQPTRELPGGALMHVMTVGDFNRDGISDLAIGGENTRLFIQLGLGDGTFNRLPAMDLIPGGDAFSACNDVDVADFNRDTIQDLVVPLGDGNGNVVLLGVGDGNFVQSARITENAVNAPYNIAVADYNGDGFQDLARAMGFGLNGLMEIANGNGNGTFQPVVRYLVPPPDSSRGAIFILAANFNADTKPDIGLLVGGAGTPSTYVLLNTSGTATPPPTVTVSAVSLSPSSVTGGSTSTGTVTLSARVSTSTVVRLSSSSGSATVPASVTIPANSASATFTVNTTQVTAATTATITATLGTSLRSANLTINPATTPTTDTVSITRAEYDSGGRRLRVEATSTRSTATLQVFVTSTNQLIGMLTNNGGGRYRADFNVASNPQNITVRSNFGGQAARPVTAR